MEHQTTDREVLGSIHTRGTVLCPICHHTILLVNTQEAVFRLDINEQLLNGALDINIRRQKRKKNMYLKN